MLDTTLPAPAAVTPDQRDRHALSMFRDPASVAVVGASDDPAKWGYWLARGALLGRDRREVFLVNRGGGTVLGAPAYRTLSELPTAPELVALCVPPASVGGVVDEALALGGRGFLGITAGVPDEDAIAGRIRAAGARLVGMNSLGIVDAGTDLQLAWGGFASGDIAIVSQSGQLGSEIAGLAARAGMGISRFVSIGNQTDVSAVELLDDLVGDEHTRVVALYLESFAGGADLIGTLARLREAGKHTLLLTVGASDASTRLAHSHTGSMTSAVDIVDAAVRAAGAVRVHTPGEVVEVARLLAWSEPPAGPRIGIIGDSGGQTGIAADVAAAANLDVAEFSSPLSTRLAALLPAGAACSNPVDLAGAGEQDLTSYLSVVQDLLDSEETDSVLLTGYFGSYSVDNPAHAAQEVDLVARMAAAARRVRKPFVVHSMVVHGPAVDAMREHGLPVYPHIETAIRAVSAATSLATTPRSPHVTATSGPALEGTGYVAAQEFLSGTGLRFPAGRVVRCEHDLAAVAELTAPYVLKASWLEHKSEAGGVRVGIADAEALRTEFTAMRARLGDGDYVVEEMDRRPDVVEVILGVRRDPDFGPVVLVGAGGTEAELHRDVAIEMAPVDRHTAHAMLRRLTSHPLLLGWRGRPAVDIEALVDLVVAVSEHAAAAPDVAEVEINPLRVGPDGALAVDALVVPAQA
ncbi:acetate--CoA ligase family protein [Speluncibacter jeojiensis]|uniref:Acetate--CoA ligase family protein n=1 Tax=Speluncibacter jeojiensis TaxID=2710754 RepID=A0A9X4LZ21_9ACTN|nr:acetate--CoA ligase family protein [Corynebacteriales bacterium D3-21]